MRLENVDESAAEYGISHQTIRNLYQRVLQSLPEVVKRRRPGPQPRAREARDSGEEGG